jgi:transcriptional regulator with XRE-family HTH domain
MQRHAKARLTPEKAFAEVIREARKKRGLSQEALGFESGYHRTYIGMLERGLMNPSLRTILSLASALNFPPGELLEQVDSYLGAGWKRERDNRKPKNR